MLFGSPIASSLRHRTLCRHQNIEQTGQTVSKVLACLTCGDSCRNIKINIKYTQNEMRRQSYVSLRWQLSTKYHRKGERKGQKEIWNKPKKKKKQHQKKQQSYFQMVTSNVVCWILYLKSKDRRNKFDNLCAVSKRLTQTGEVSTQRVTENYK